jgi:UDP-3-O-[3-hydroxymyristoyl] glucosamine N-acyltransferase
LAIRLGQLIEQLGGSLHGDPDFLVQKISPLETATSSSLAFLSNPLYRSQLATTQAGCVIVSPEMQSLVRAGSACIVSPNPYLYFAKVTQLWRHQQVAECD